MTVIVALKDRMLSDSKVSASGDTHYRAAKIYRHKDELIGVAGGNRSIEKFMRWYRGPRAKMLDFNEAKEDDGGDRFSVIVLNRRGLWYYDDCSLPDMILGDFHGAGTGWPAAHAAMLAGADPRRAVEIACEVTTDCGPPVQEFTL